MFHWRLGFKGCIPTISRRSGRLSSAGRYRWPRRTSLFNDSERYAVWMVMPAPIDPIPQMEAIFPKDAFTANVVPWLMFNRQGLDILIHPLIDDEVEDHTAHAVWLGKPVELLTDKLKHGPTIPELMPTLIESSTAARCRRSHRWRLPSVGPRLTAARLMDDIVAPT